MPEAAQSCNIACVNSWQLALKSSASRSVRQQLDKSYCRLHVVELLPGASLPHARLSIVPSAVQAGFDLTTYLLTMTHQTLSSEEQALRPPALHRSFFASVGRGLAAAPKQGCSILLAQAATLNNNDHKYPHTSGNSSM